MTRLEEYQAYCTKNGMADTMAGFALFNAWQDAEEKIVELDEFFSYAIQSDLENGVKWLNELKVKKFYDNYPQISAGIAKVSAMAELIQQ
jgi:hypothetical protein